MEPSSHQNEEMEHRRLLFKAAANGDVLAQQELEREYHVRVMLNKNSPQKKVCPQAVDRPPHP